MAQPTFTLDDAGSICVTPFLIREQRTEDLLAADHAREAGRFSGVCYGGMGPAPRTPRTREQVRADAEGAARTASAFAKSPRGRFLLAIRELENLGWAAEAERARSAMSRGFARPDEPADPREVGVALASIEPINHPDARMACMALAELLIVAVAHAAE
ncbi:MAG: hypothetical protein JWQ97_972 [Phenylobacterium sp.]|nr:hypothetical protein [Phenylobacterium sp.]